MGVGREVVTPLTWQESGENLETEIMGWKTLGKFKTAYTSEMIPHPLC